ncbi:MAG: hypothetical protein ACRC8K_23645 [Waterburya sp.]
MLNKHQINICYQQLGRVPACLWHRAFFTSKFPEKEIDRCLKKYGETVVGRVPACLWHRASLLLWDKITKGSSPLDIVDRLQESRNKEELTKVKNFYKDEFLWVWLFFVSDNFKNAIVEIAKKTEELINVS